MSPMMSHYKQIKAKYAGAIIFYRLGDFYELFFEDATLMSKELELTLTKKSCGDGDFAPMCGVPAKALDIYVQKAVSLGYKIAIVEQLSDVVKGELVERDVVRIITSGTIIEDSILDESSNNYLASVCKIDNIVGISWIDISTGEFSATSLSVELSNNELNDLLVMISPAELLVDKNMFSYAQKLDAIVLKQIKMPELYEIEDFTFKDSVQVVKTQLKVDNFDNIFPNKSEEAIYSAGRLLRFIKDTQKRNLSHINTLKWTKVTNYMQLDYTTRKNLELTKNTRDGGKYGTILWLLDKAQTSMGKRLLKKYIEQPLQNKKAINMRLDGVEAIYKNMLKRDEITSKLKQIQDIERICGKISYGSINPKEAVALKKSLMSLPDIKNLLTSFLDIPAIKEVYDNIISFDSEISELNKIKEDAPIKLIDGNVIESGVSAELDECYNALTQGGNWITNLENAEKEETGIKNLKIKFNNVFGYFIEVSNSFKSQVPFRYERKQTCVNCERYFTVELKELEDKILNAKDRIYRLESQIFSEIKQNLLEAVSKMQKTAQYIAYLDVLCSFATISIENNFIKPKIVNENEQLLIEDGRHPIVEKINKEVFIPNDTLMDNEQNRTIIITGPNMAGKSTYMRQVAVIVLLAHIGCFVPAKHAQIPIIDRIFTRIGATDDLAYGQSTFMVEMNEVSNILKNATKNSLILLDEVGRGTSTFDGLSIAWAVMEYISTKIKAKTLFSTHYHELTELEGIIEGVKNYKVTVKEYNGEVIFLRKIVRGSANRSFGIEVASIVGLPKELIVRAKEFLSKLEQSDVNKQVQKEQSVEQKEKVTNYAEIINRLKELDMNKISPMEAFSILTDLLQKIE